MRELRHDRPRAPADSTPSRDERASALLRWQRTLSACRSLDEVLSTVADAVAEVLPVRDRVSLAFLEPDRESLRVHRLLPPVDERPESLPRVRVGGTIVGQVATDGIARVVADVRSDRNITFGHASHDGIRSTASVPVVVQGRVVGAMNTGSRVVGACDEALLEVLADVAAIVGPAVFAFDRGEARTPGASELPDGLVGVSAAFRTLVAQARRAAASDETVLLTGETGVGKTALARAIHGWSPRRAAPFVPVHIADLPSTLVETELFGHERGAFTGALARRTGRFELADGGTVFLDEIGEAPQTLQSKLLRVLQDGTFERVGGGTVEADVRIIAATNRDLAKAVEKGEFRDDLFYRLNVVPIHVPPLRERPEDLEPIAEWVLSRLTTPERPSLRLAPEAWDQLRAHPWPGNVRELESVLRRAAVLEDGDVLHLQGFPGHARSSATEAAANDWPTRDENERRYLKRVLAHTNGVIEGARGAAKLLGMQPSTLRSRLQRLGIPVDSLRKNGRGR